MIPDDCHRNEDEDEQHYEVMSDIIITKRMKHVRTSSKGSSNDSALRDPLRRRRACCFRFADRASTNVDVGDDTGI